MIEVASWISALRLPLLVGYSCYAIVFAYMSSRGPANAPQRVSVWFVVLSLVTLVALRLPRVFVNVPFDPDEAQWLASAMKYHANMTTWLSVDTTSSGPVNIYPLMWPFLFGADTGFAAARITTIVLLGGTWLLTFSALTSAPRPMRICLAACLIVFLGGTRVSRFTPYSSEVVPVFLLMCASRIVLMGVERPLTGAQICLAGVSLGLVPFAKLQAVIIAIVIGVVLAWQVVLPGPRSYRSVTLLLLSACLPGVILLAPLAAAGGLPDFWASYVGFATNYLGKGWGEIEASNRFVASIRALKVILGEDLIRGYVLVMAASTALALVAPVKEMASSVQARVRVLKSPQVLRWGIALAVLGSSIWSVMAPARPFAHYALLVLSPGALVAGLACSLGTPSQKRGWAGSRGYSVIGGISIVILLGLAIGERSTSYDLEITGTESLFRSGQLFADPEAERGRVFVWGWMPQWYVWSGWTPATRDMHTYNQIWPTPLRGYFRDRLMNDLQSDPPEYMIDAVAPGSFGFGSPEQEGITSFPQLAGFVREHYELLSRQSPDFSCPSVFARTSTAKALEQRFVRPSRIRASSEWSSSAGSYAASRVVDGVVFESCPDAWWPKNDDASREIMLDLDAPQAIATIELLNTRGGRLGDRASKGIRVMAYNGSDVVMDQSVRARRFPYWTRIALPDRAGPVDRLVVRIETHAGVGGGLNEIRLRRRL